MFVAKLAGNALEPDFVNGTYGLFQKFNGGDRQGKILLVSHNKINDPFTCHAYTVREYWCERDKSEGEDWEHVQVTLKPKNSDADQFIIDVKDENEVQVLAELIGSL
jgi:hypothetical protein